MIRLAIWSSIGVPRKTIRSFSSSEKMSNARSPRALVSTTYGNNVLDVAASRFLLCRLCVRLLRLLLCGFRRFALAFFFWLRLRAVRPGLRSPPAGPSSCCVSSDRASDARASGGVEELAVPLDLLFVAAAGLRDDASRSRRRYPLRRPRSLRRRPAGSAPATASRARWRWAAGLRGLLAASA